MYLDMLLLCLHVQATCLEIMSHIATRNDYWSLKRIFADTGKIHFLDDHLLRGLQKKNRIKHNRTKEVAILPHRPRDKWCQLSSRKQIADLRH